VIQTDHRSLSFLADHKENTKIQQKALLKLMDLHFKIKYKKGISNVVADALSRYANVDHVHAITTCVPTWVEPWRKWWRVTMMILKLKSC
jgi:hypothetical protein